MIGLAIDDMHLTPRIHTPAAPPRGATPPARSVRRAIAVACAGAWLSLVGVPASGADLRTAHAGSAAASARHADFGLEHPGTEARLLADWIARSHDHGGAPFLIVDKRNARLYVFDADAHMKGTAPVLLGAAKGDDSVPGIGERPIRDIKPHERTTPAGRFLAEAGRNTQGEDIVWIDYDAAVSMHRVRATNPRERRLERLASATVADNRISYGCINVPAAFFDAHVSPIFAGERKAPVYVLPETRTLRAAFRGYDGDESKAAAPRTPQKPARIAALH